MSNSRLIAVAAGLLVAGMISFMIGAAIPLAWLEKPGLVPEVWSAPLERYLQLIAQHRRSWSWANGFMIAAVVLNGAGLAALAGFAGQPAVTAGAAGYGIAGVFWIVVASYRTIDQGVAPTFHTNEAELRGPATSCLPPASRGGIRHTAAAAPARSSASSSPPYVSRTPRRRPRAADRNDFRTCTRYKYGNDGYRYLAAG